MKMTEQESQEYMAALIAKGDGLEGAEAICLAEWQEVVKNLETATNSLNQGRAEMRRLEGVVQQLTGQREAYFKTLISTEEGRRNAANGLELVLDDNGEPKLDAFGRPANPNLIPQPPPEEILGGRT